MPEYTYLLENRLSSAQKHALTQVRSAAREAGMTVFLTGGAVRDLTTGSSVRNFNFAVQGNALKLEPFLVARGAEVWGTHEPTRTLTLWFPGSVRADVASTRSEEYPKPGKPVYAWSTIVEDLRRRDFTANAMALSLNEGSYGLLLDPLNGVADIEARLLRLASNYGFIEDPSRLIRATRLRRRLGWQIEEKTATRYANAKEAESIKVLSPYLRGYELEKIASEEDALDILKALEAEGWMQHLLPAWTSAKADVAGLENLRKNWIQLLMQGVIADLTVAHLDLLTAQMKPDEIAALKKALIHPGLVRHWEALEESAREFSKLLTGKTAATPSATWKLLTTSAAEPVLWLAHTRKAGAVDAKFKSFFTIWPEFKKRVPAAMMLEMRITPELPGYAELLDQLFYQLIDGNLETDEQMRAFLEPWSPPAPPPPTMVRRSRAKKSESKTKRRISAPDEDEDGGPEDDDDDDADEVPDADAEDEEIVEDDALSTVLDKLHADDNPVDHADDDRDDDEVAPEPKVAPGTLSQVQAMDPAKKSLGDSVPDGSEVLVAPRSGKAKVAAKSPAAGKKAPQALETAGPSPESVKERASTGIEQAVTASQPSAMSSSKPDAGAALVTKKAKPKEGSDQSAKSVEPAATAKSAARKVVADKRPPEQITPPVTSKTMATAVHDKHGAAKATAPQPATQARKREMEVAAPPKSPAGAKPPAVSGVKTTKPVAVPAKATKSGTKTVAAPAKSTKKR